ncbi:MAG: J domain-containing protein [Clostridia bacterium]|nr:J domain-containing protein [Clostridia bacterium]
MIFKDYYKILGFDTNKVSINDIKNAYREKAKKYHPDRNVENTDTEEIFKDINEAYRTLSNEKLRRKYDFKWYRFVGMKKKKKNKPKQKRTIKQMLTEIFFGGINRNKQQKEEKKPQYGDNIITRITITIEQAFFGTNKQLKLRTVKGRESSFTIKIPAGIQNNDRLRIIGQGRQGKNGGKNGDLFVYVNIANNKRLKIEGINLIYELPLQVWEAALGTKKTIKILNEKIQIVIPTLTSSGRILVIKGKGYKDGRGGRGDLHIITKIVLPQKLSKKQNEIYQELKKVAL